MTPADAGGEGVLCVDLGGTHLRVATFDAAGAMLEKAVVQTPHDDPGALVELMNAVRARSTVGIHEAVIAVPGPISYRDGVPLRLPNLPGWEEAVRASRLSAQLGLRIHLANDADLAALGEHRFGAGRGCSDMVYITSSTGVGAGVILGGRLLHGRWSLAEVGHTIIDWRTGATVEDLGSGTALERTAGAPGAEVAARARAGDPEAVEAFREVAQAFAIGVHNLVHCFMPERVVVGGGVSEAGDLLLGPVRRQLDRCEKACSAKGADVVIAAGGDNVGLLGAFALWQDSTGTS